MPRDYRLLGGGSAGDEIGSSNSSSSMPRNNGMGDAEAPLAQETASDSAKPRVVLVHPTSTGLALNVEAVAAVGLHWKDTREAAELAAAPTGPQCSPTEAYSWLLRAWTVFLICWTPAIIMIGAFSHIRMSTEEEGSLADWRSFLWGGCAGLSCFQWGVFVAVVIVLVLVFFLGATAPLSMPALLVFSPLEDVNLALLLADKVRTAKRLPACPTEQLSPTHETVGELILTLWPSLYRTPSTRLPYQTRMPLPLPAMYK